MQYFHRHRADQHTLRVDHEIGRADDLLNTVNARVISLNPGVDQLKGLREFVAVSKERLQIFKDYLYFGVDWACGMAQISEHNAIIIRNFHDLLEAIDSAAHQPCFAEHQVLEAVISSVFEIFTSLRALASSLIPEEHFQESFKLLAFCAPNLEKRLKEEEVFRLLYDSDNLSSLKSSYLSLSASLHTQLGISQVSPEGTALITINAEVLMAQFMNFALRGTELLKDFEREKSVSGKFEAFQAVLPVGTFHGFANLSSRIKKGLSNIKGNSTDNCRHLAEQLLKLTLEIDQNFHGILEYLKMRMWETSGNP